jgi:hypothetical protein
MRLLVNFFDHFDFIYVFDHFVVAGSDEVSLLS